MGNLFEQIDPNLFGDLEYESFPKMVRVRQSFESPIITNLEETVQNELMKPDIESRIKPGMKIAVLVGSRGIADIDRITLAVIESLKSKGAYPFIVPAMASHGGATEAGQRDLLASYNITEVSMGVEIRSTMKPELLGITRSGVKIYFDVNALHADGVIPINRIKAHTAFRADRESGLIKMLAIGAGKQMGAESLHAHGADTFGDLLVDAFHIICEKANVLFGMGIVENSQDKTAILEAIQLEMIEQREPDLLKLANKYMPKLLVDEFDVLIVGATGKNFSGDGMDPNVTGRYAVPTMSGGPKYQRMAVLDVTDESHGNAAGIGLADVTTLKLIKKINLEYMYMNAFTSKMVLPLVKIPIVAKNDRQAIGVALRTCVRVKKGEERLVYIKNTLDLSEIWISTALINHIENNPRLTVISDPFDMNFSTSGNLC